MEDSNAKENLSRRSPAQRSPVPSTAFTKRGETGVFATKCAEAEDRPASASVSSHYTAANLARVWPANPEIVTNRSAPSMDSGTHGPFGPNVASPAAEARARALARARRSPMAANLALVTRRKRKLATTSTAPSTANGANGGNGMSVPSPAAGAPRPGPALARDPSSVEKTAPVSRVRPRSAELLCAPSTACSRNGPHGPNVTRSAEVENNSGLANAKVLSTVVTIATEIALKSSLATSSNAPSMAPGSRGDNGATALKHAQAASPREHAHATDHSTVARTAAVIAESRGIATRAPVRSMVNGRHGVFGESVAPLAEVARGRASVSAKDPNSAETIVPVMSSNRPRSATRPCVPLTESGENGDHGESAPAGNNTPPARATVLNTVARTASEIARGLKIVRCLPEMKT